MTDIKPQLSQEKTVRARSDTFINGNELIFDAVMLVFVFLFNRDFSPGWIAHSLSPTMIAAFYLIFAYCLPWYMGIIYNQFQGYIRKAGRRVLLAVFGALVMFIFLSISYCIVQTGDPESNKAGFMLCGGIVLLMMGCIIGGTYIPDRRPSAEVSEEISPVMVISIFTLTILGLIYCGINFSGITGQLHGFIGSSIRTVGPIFLYLGTPVVFIIFLLVVINIKRVLIKLKLLRTIMELKHFMLPFTLTALLLLFNNLNALIIRQMVQSITGSYSGFMVLIPLIISGVIPFRIILIFTPPVRFLNIMIGIIAFYFYIHQLLLR